MLSWRCPAVTTIESGRPLPSQARWILLVSPPRLRPIASSCGCTIPFCVSLARFATCACCVLVRSSDGAVHAHLPLDLAYRVRLRLRMSQQAVPGIVTTPAHEAIVAGLSRAVG